ncbi:MAG: FMN-binding protein [Spirochaetaceae bacterium]|nr:MAG: FMN-binding protein [Spirochaetaceae bacterium]
MNKQSLPYTVVFSFIVCFVFVFLLSLTHQATSELVQLNQELRQQRAVLRALAVDFETDDQIRALFADIEAVEYDDMTLYRVQRGGETLYARIFAGSGVWGTINGVLGVDREVTRTVGLEIIDHNETPGLGGRIDEPWFKQQFTDKPLLDGRLEVVREGGTEGQDGKVDAVTGATGTSRSMQTILNRELERLQSVLGGEA